MDIDAAAFDKFPQNPNRPLCFGGRSAFSGPVILESFKKSMRLSRFFLPILRETPKEAEIISHRLMLRAGMMRQEAAGIYAFLPLGFRVLQKICQIVREEQNRAGAIELLMPTIQSADLWRESGRYEAYGKEMLRIEDRHKREMLYGPTNEEMITEIFRAYVRSYKDLPLNLYHMQWKFRDEVRPRFGLMRGREFLMKDAYSFDLDQVRSTHSYNKMFVAYLRTFARMGLKSIPMRAESGPIGGNLSHEFIILAQTGESEVFCHKDYLDMAVPAADVNFDDVAGLQGIVNKWTSQYAATSEMHDAAAFAKVATDRQVSARGIEVGHIFYFGTKYSEPMKAVVATHDGKEVPVHMGSYGIGPSRLVAAIIEASHDDAGIIWPEPVAPFKVAILNLKQGASDTDAACEQLYRDLTAKGIEVLYHDLDERPGAKFATADLIGIPYQVLVGPRSLAEGKFEVKKRSDGSRESLSPAVALDLLSR
jgi:prolyl-tRNA synthetase